MARDSGDCSMCSRSAAREMKLFGNRDKTSKVT
jgi:hypothetical protein